MAHELATKKNGKCLCQLIIKIIKQTQLLWQCSKNHTHHGKQDMMQYIMVLGVQLAVIKFHF